MPDASVTARPRRVGALVGGLLFVLTLAALTGAAVLDAGSTDAERAAATLGHGLRTGVTGLVLAGAGAAVLAVRLRHPVGWVLSLMGLLAAVDGLAESWTVHAVAAEPALPGAGLSLWVVAQLGSLLLVGLPLVLLLYPDGRLVEGRWRVVAVVAASMAFSLPAVLLFAPREVMDFEAPLPERTGMPELPLPEQTTIALLLTTRALTLLSLLLAVLVVFVRHRRARGIERVQLRWLLWAALVCVLFVAVALVAPYGAVTSVALALSITVTAGSVVVGIVRPTLTDVDALMGGTTVYAAVAVFVVGIDLAVLALVDRLLGDRLTERESILLVLLVAVSVYAPVRAWLGGALRRGLVGRRADRYDVLSDVAARLERSPRVADQLPALTSAVASAFKLGFVRVEVFGHAGEVLTASQGAPPTAVREFPVTYGGEQVGRLVLSAQGLRSMLSRHDQALLFDVVRQGALAVRSARLASELQAGREQLVLAREDDRRRIRRDLHDGLGPVLGGVAMRLDAAGNALAADPATAGRLIADSRRDITEALADVRRLVHGLRPPALDDLGLLAALGQQVERTRSPHLEVSLDAADLPPLPAAVEVAAYRIVSEALANTARHAAAHRCTVRLVSERGALLVSVADDGAGIPEERTAGVGLRSIRERAEELGGRASVSCPESGGTLVQAWLPVLVGSGSAAAPTSISPTARPTTRQPLEGAAS